MPISSFYEWQTIGSDSRKQPWSIRVRNTPLFAIAGVWERRRSPNKLISRIHDRMPVIVRPEHYDAWLDTENEDFASLAKVIEPYSANEIELHRVSTRVNSVRNDDPSLLDAVQETKEPPTLFG